MRSRFGTALLGLIVAQSLTGVLAAGAAATAAAQGDRGLVPLPVEELPVSLERIKRQLDRLRPTHEERSLLRLSYYIQVYGRSPRIDLMQGFDVHNGPVPYGAPTHAELLAVMSPREFRPAVVKLNSIIGWTFKSLNAPTDQELFPVSGNPKKRRSQDSRSSNAADVAHQRVPADVRERIRQLSSASGGNEVSISCPSWLKVTRICTAGHTYGAGAADAATSRSICRFSSTIRRFRVGKTYS